MISRYQVYVPVTDMYKTRVVEAESPEDAIKKSKAGEGIGLKHVEKLKPSEEKVVRIKVSEVSSLLKDDARKAAMGVADAMLDLANDMDFDPKTFIEKMHCGHRTLQQSFTQLCLQWLYSLAELQNFDLRNEASVLAARKVREALGPRGDLLPFI